MQALVSLVIEKLECMKATGKQNYDYLTLQATENSIPFYESLGFVRVGGITEDDKYEEKQAKLRGEETPSQDSDASSSNGSLPPQSEIVSSPVDTYVTKDAGETPVDVAKKLNVSVWDIIFLNHYVYPDINTRSRLMKGTSLFVPAAQDTQAEASSHATRSRDLGAEPSAPQWYIADENDTPRIIAKKFEISCKELVDANRGRLPELQSQSRLKEGTRIKVSHFHVDDDKHLPYCHWSFPDDSFETSEPSYMMVRKLNRRKGNAAKVKPVESSFAVPVTECTAPPAELFTEVVQPATAVEAKGKTPKSNNKKKHPAKPKKPKRPLSGYLLFMAEQRELLEDEFVGMKPTEVTKVVSKMWRELPEDDKAPYQAQFEKEQPRWRKAMEKYERELAAFHEAHPELKPSNEDRDSKSQSLFNKVVKLNAQGVAQTGSEYEYYFVLTYIPDLCWAHLAPLECVGIYGPDKPKSEGRPIWMLVDESEGKEVDISGSFCIPVRSRATKRTVDADCEQWDIMDEEDTTPVSARKFRARPARVVNSRATEGISEGSSRSATKPLTGTVDKKGKKKRGRPRKHPLPEPSAEKATPKNGGQTTKQKHSATKPLNGSIVPKKKRGRPRKHPLPEAGQLSPLTGFVKPNRGRLTEEPLSEPIDKKPSSAGITQAGEPKKKRGRPRKHPRPPEAAKTPSTVESVEPEKKGGGRPRKHPLPQPAADEPAVDKRRGRQKQGVEKRVGSDTEDDEWGGAEEVKPKSRGRPKSATKPLSGSIEPKKRKRGRPSRKSMEEDSRPVKRRKLPRRDAAPAAGSYQDVEHSDIDVTPAKRTPKKRRGTQSRTEWTPDETQLGMMRTVPMTRAEKKLSTTSPLVFSPRRARFRA